MDTPLSQPHPWATVGMGKGGDYNWFDPTAAVGHGWGRNLPHWRQRGAIYFVTFRTADSIPAPVLAEWQRERAAWLAAHPEPHDAATTREYHRLFTERMHRFLDDCHGDCPFRSAEPRQCVVEVLTHLDGADDRGYALDAFVVMPNHAHVLVAPRGEAQLSEICKTWKSVASHRVNKLLRRRGAFWQEESWDHIVRSAGHLERYRRYIAENPKRLPQV